MKLLSIGCGYIGAVLAILIIAALGFEYRYQIIRLLYVLFFLSLAVYLVGLYLKRIACKIEIDFENEEICFHMCTGKQLAFSFNNIQNITIGINIAFYIKERKIIYNGNQCETIIKCCKRIQKQN